MARCYLTGVEIKLADGFVLDSAAANRALRNLQRKLEAVQRLLDQLGQRDAEEIHNRCLKNKVTRYHRRLVCQAVAEVLAAVCPEEQLFLSWSGYRDRSRFAMLPGHGGADPETGNTGGE